MSVALSWYTTELRIKIGDIASTVYTDAQLESLVTSAVNTLSGVYYQKFEVYSSGSVSYVRLLNTTDDSPTDYDNEVILCLSSLNVAYADANAYSRNAIKIRDIRGTIDTSITAKSILDNIESLKDRCEKMISTGNKNGSRSSYLPKQAVPQEYTPDGNGSSVTFISEYNK